jgi:hypothetical protein
MPSGGSTVGTGNTKSMGRLCTVHLLIKVACFVIKFYKYFQYKNKLI